MALGPGKYDDVATRARDETNAEGVVLMVFNGKFGPGFSVQASMRVLSKLPAILRSMADSIEAEIQPQST